jgi:hypothetical protein
MPLDLMSSKIKQGPKTNQRLTLGCGFSKQRPRKDLQKKSTPVLCCQREKSTKEKGSTVNWLGVHFSHVMTNGERKNQIMSFHH